MTELSTCPWSGETFPAKKGKVFACPAHKKEFEKAAHAYIKHMLDTGMLSHAMLKAWWEGHKTTAQKPLAAQGGTKQTQQAAE